MWYTAVGSGGNSTTGNNIAMLPDRLTDTDFTNNIIPTVTRTWVDSSWRDGTETNERQTLADKFWLLGEGNINVNVSWMSDDTSDTSIYNEVFTEATSGETNTRVRYSMTEGGTEGSACRWWLRSAYSGESSTVCCVDYNGYVSNGGSNNSNISVLPICLIG